MRFIIRITKSNDGWGVEIINARNQEVLNTQPRQLRCIGEGAQLFPLPPQEEIVNLPDTHPAFDLLNSPDSSILKTAYNQIISRDVGVNNRVVRFGRYLFHALLGDQLWQEIDKAAGNEPIELALYWHKDDIAINRLPWEMMHDGNHFLAQLPQISITRRIVGTKQNLGEIQPPRVLFVVGSSLNDSVIRPGAEYLGLLRSIGADNGARLKTNLILEASPRRLKAAVESFKPTVVHFICHGEFNASGQCYLKMRDDDKHDASTQLFSAGLIDNLRRADDGQLPQIVVMSACYSAKLNDRVQYLSGGEINAPLAVDLVNAGIPIVVGMGGRVSDQACRLFTRRFYEALLEGEDIAMATADGRRAGIIANSGTSPDTSVDWAMPLLFLSEAIEEARVSIRKELHLDQWQGFVSSHADIPEKYPAFCGRMDLFQLYDQLITDDGVFLIRRQRQGELQALAVAVNQADSSLGNPRLGRTRVLHEMAAQAVLDGHVPCLIDEKLLHGKDWPHALDDLIKALMRAGHVTAQRFGLGWQANHLLALRDLKNQIIKAQDLHEEVRKVYRIDNNPDDPLVIAAALRLDLMQLLSDARALLPEVYRERTKLLLMIDDLHRMDTAADEFLNNLMGATGLRARKSDIKIVFTYSSVAAPGQELAVKSITTWLEQTTWSERFELNRFQPPVEDRSAYEHLLLCWYEKGKNKRPLAVSNDAPTDFVNSFFETLTQSVEGYPSNLKDKFDLVIRAYLNLPVQVLKDANDEDQLLKIQQMKRGG